MVNQRRQKQRLLFRDESDSLLHLLVVGNTAIIHNLEILVPKFEELFFLVYFFL